jgi:hypothetical protein
VISAGISTEYKRFDGCDNDSTPRIWAIAASRLSSGLLVMLIAPFCARLPIVSGEPDLHEAADCLRPGRLRLGLARNPGVE